MTQASEGRGALHRSVCSHIPNALLAPPAGQSTEKAVRDKGTGDGVVWGWVGPGNHPLNMQSLAWGYSRMQGLWLRTWPSLEVPVVGHKLQDKSNLG